MEVEMLPKWIKFHLLKNNFRSEIGYTAYTSTVPVEEMFGVCLSYCKSLHYGKPGFV